MKRTAILLALAALLLLANVAPAAGSTNYRLNWLTPMTSGGGGAASSANYAVRFTVGQSAAGSMAGNTSKACLGYQCGTSIAHTVFLPLVIR